MTKRCTNQRSLLLLYFNQCTHCCRVWNMVLDRLPFRLNIILLCLSIYQGSQPDRNFPSGNFCMSAEKSHSDGKFKGDTVTGRNSCGVPQLFVQMLLKIFLIVFRILMCCLTSCPCLWQMDAFLWFSLRENIRIGTEGKTRILELRKGENRMENVKLVVYI